MVRLQYEAKTIKVGRPDGGDCEVALQWQRVSRRGLFQGNNQIIFALPRAFCRSSFHFLWWFVTMVKVVADHLVKSSGIRPLLHTFAVDVIMDEGKIRWRELSDFHHLPSVTSNPFSSGGGDREQVWSSCDHCWQVRRTLKSSSKSIKGHNDCSKSIRGQNCVKSNIFVFK